ncbi:protein ACCELERATED CELL DEATH 6-like isoform X1 [Actinidia eriantha]|uniref:protein ACCELERATED CELL DEATH 6-like isoform X1 n=1 Tax=Actinidia eriantha TaxID=165200 RepID=UPI002585EBE4|nr:protein ACCELERATED CELL DEATH 6-like isoform X1 [Actinidia eriantha]
MGRSIPDEKLRVHLLNGELYEALMKREDAKVVELCKQIPEGPLHILSIHKDSVLHMATYYGKRELALNLLEMLRNSESDKLTMQNDTGNTMLHEAANSDETIPVAMEMLRKDPKLLGMRNKYGETALFCAARYGQTKMFKFLDIEVDSIFAGEGQEEERKSFYQKKDKTTILHATILTGHFDLALHMAKKHGHLLSIKDGDNLTPLQLLACNPAAFASGNKQSYLKKLIHSCVRIEDTSETEEGELCYKIPLWGAVRKQKLRYESAVRLAKFLIERDTSWEVTEPAIDKSKPSIHYYGEPSFTFHDQAAGEEKKIPKYETALLLATKKGILEIVEKILTVYPQAVEHIDDQGHNILHKAIMFRQICILDLLEKPQIPMTRLARKIDNKGNTILHMVGIKKDDYDDKDKRSPALLLRENLLLFERVEKISVPHLTKYLNNERKTAGELFETKYTKLWEEAKEWLKRTAENCSIVSVLIATVAFAAAYTVPGGPNQNTGYPILENKSFFVIFALADVLSLAFALASVMTFLSILTSPFQFKDFKQSLPRRLMLGVTLLIVSVSMMMVAFAATVFLLVRDKEQWTRIALCSVAFFPVSIFVLSYFPLYTDLMKPFMRSLKKTNKAFPWFSGVFIRSWNANSFSFGTNHSSMLSSPNQPLASSSKRPTTPQTTQDLV